MDSTVQSLGALVSHKPGARVRDLLLEPPDQVVDENGTAGCDDYKSHGQDVAEQAFRHGSLDVEINRQEQAQSAKRELESAIDVMILPGTQFGLGEIGCMCNS